jgi:hypothetical protein
MAATAGSNQSPDEEGGHNIAHGKGLCVTNRKTTGPNEKASEFLPLPHEGSGMFSFTSQNLGSWESTVRHKRQQAEAFEYWSARLFASEGLG